MCGIAGILNFDGILEHHEELSLKMLSAIRNRGPDECGLYIDNCISLGHTRLSIIGIQGGTQPICNEDRSLWIVYNGEIFNYKDLKLDLVKQGHKFATNTDTEVFLHLFEEYGHKCLDMINGQFAVAIWNAESNTLFLARDRVGIRPLFYFHNGYRFIFASEIKSIFMDPSIPRIIDLKSLFQIFTFWSTITPNTVFKDIKSVSPGHYMFIRPHQKSIKEKPFWKIPLSNIHTPFNGSFSSAIEELRSLIEDAVKIRMVADVPVGAYLSGGLDSSIISTLASRITGDHLRTFSISFKASNYDESPYQDVMINSLDTRHTRNTISNKEILNNLPSVIWHCEQPILRTSPVPMYLLSKNVHENNYKVALTGEGADELFAGYNIFKEAKIRRFCSRQPNSKLRPLLFGKLYPYIFNQPSRARAMMTKIFAASPKDLESPWFSHQIRWANGSRFFRFLSKDMQHYFSNIDIFDDLQKRIPNEFSQCDTLTKAQYLEMDIFLSNYLLSSQGDRVALANALEIRLPFLDHRLIDFSFRLPSKWKLNGLDEKYILKKASKNIIPESILKRSKQPYRAPIKEIFVSNNDNDYIDWIASDEYLNRSGIFNSNIFRSLFKRFQCPDRNVSNEFQNMVMIGALSTQIIYQQFIDNFPNHVEIKIKPDKIIYGNRYSRTDRIYNKLSNFLNHDIYTA
jgi:asparagine synthase (glutamine-hydrolysing)